MPLALMCGAVFNPATLFANGEPGALFLPSPSTCFTDTARTTPAAVGDAVAGMTDLSGRGNHASQSTSAARPILRQAGSTYYLEFDGVDDCMVTGSIDFTGTNKITVFAGVRKTSDVASSIFLELGPNANTNNGSFFIAAPGSAATGDYSPKARGNISALAAGYIAVTYAAPITNVLSVQYDLSGATKATEIIPRFNGVPDQLAPDGNTLNNGGNFGNYAINMGRRNQTSAPFTGYMYGLIVRGAATDASLLVRTEKYMAVKTGITF